MFVLPATEHPDLRLSIELLLSEEPGVTIVGAASETEGLLALIRSSNPDIVILDWDLPGRPVARLLAEARASDSQVRFIVLCPQPEVQEQARQAGADAYVVKGSPPEQLLAVFRKTRILAKSAAGEPAKEPLRKKE
jgi:DNA-binding NarL/FixJ family response regulator